MAKYKSIVTTEAGLVLVEDAAYMGHAIQFTALKTGNGTYDGTEDLAAATDLKSVCQTFGVGSVAKKEANIMVRAAINNSSVTEGYSITEIGLYAMDPFTDTEVLYAIIIAETGNEDYFPPYSEAPTSITLEMVIEITESAEAATFNVLPVEGAYVPVESFNELLNGTTPVGNALKLGGIDASKYYSFTTENELPQGTDFNDIKTIGNYSFRSANVASFINAPFSNNSGGVLKVEQTAVSSVVNYIKQTVYRANQGVFERWLKNSTWTQWETVTTTADLANYLPLSGGTINGEVAIKTTTENTATTLEISNALRKIYIQAQKAGAFRINDSTNSKDILTASLSGEYTFNGTASENLPLSGGKVHSTSTSPLEVSGPTSNCQIAFYNGGVQSGGLGFSGKDKPTVTNSAWNKTYDILHTGNKPTGTYTGNGSATERTVNIGGIGDVMVICSSNTIALVGFGGFIAMSGGSVSGATNAYLGSTGVYHCANNHTALNANGVTYTYWLL